MGSLLVVTGPPGAGKSTVAALLAERLDRSILVAGDSFFDFLAAGAIEPWLPEADQQNRVVASAAARATARFAQDYDVIYDGVLGPWHLSMFMEEGGFSGADVGCDIEVDYAVILPPVEVCLDRIATRRGHGFVDAGAGRWMHDEFANANIEARHVVDLAGESATAIADVIAERGRTGALRVTR